ncbi:MAG TPA: phosphopantothenoylcysteine decarboxylase [Verrucomicrobiae bacterium]|nr:phosphopantothenoylcysteine decarboxylase [Verrucomicrobiae bacterium]
MKCVVTAGPSYEPLDEVRRLTNFSTGQLGSGLANFLAAHGHEVILLLGYYASYRGDQKARQVDTFTTTADLRSRLQAFAGQEIGAVFHAAAVSDFTFGKIWERNERGELIGCDERKTSTRKGSLLAELQPTPKIIADLRAWFPRARIVGWKYELDGDRAGVIELARQQMAKNRTDACVVNGAAYGGGFGLVTEGGDCVHSTDAATLYVALDQFIKA